MGIKQCQQVVAVKGMPSCHRGGQLTLPSVHGCQARASPEAG